jgi:hypothetical protein
MTIRARIGSTLVLLCATVAVGSVSPPSAPTCPERRLPGRVSNVPSRIPAAIEVNRGQAPPDVAFVARTSAYSACIAPAAVVLSADQGRSLVRLRLVGARHGVAARAERVLGGRSHYIRGDDPGRWVRHVPHVDDVLVEDLYPGIDLRWKRGQAGEWLEYRFELAPGVDAADIVLAIDGATCVRVDEDGNLLTATPAGEFQHSRPVAFQIDDGGRRLVPVAFRELGDGRVGFRIGAHDTNASVVIDPEISYSTYFGGSDGDVGTDVAVDDDGSAIIVGRGFSSNMPTTDDAFQESHGGGARDGFVAKLSSSGSSLVFATYLGGDDEDELDAVVVDGDGDIYVAGESYSSDFPTVSALQTSSGGSADVVVAKLQSDGSDLDWSTYYGGSGIDKGRGIDRDEEGDLYITGYTESSDFPTSTNALQTSLGGGTRDAFVFKLDGSGSSTSYSSYIGGSGDDRGHGIAVDSDGAAIVCGLTRSTDFPTVSPLYGSHSGGTIDAFVSKVAANGSSLTYSTYLGGSGTDVAWDVAVDGDDDAYVTGYTTSTNYPTAAALQSTNAGGRDAFVTKINGAGSSLVYSTYLGGSADDDAKGIDVTSGGSACIGGITRSSNFPTEAAVQETYGGGTTDGFVAMIDASGDELTLSTFIGGSGQDFEPSAFLFAGNVVLDASTNAYFTGRTQATDFPTENAAQSSLGGGTDAFVVKISSPVPPLVPIDLTATVLSDDVVGLEWTVGSSNAADHEIQRAEGAGAFSTIETVGGDADSFDDSGLSASTEYSWRVRATNEFGESDWSNAVTATTPAPPPSNVTASSSSNRSVTITWEDDTDDETGYIVERAAGCPGLTWTVIATLAPDTTSFTDRTVRPETQYSYRVRTAGVDADSSPSAEVCITTGPANPTSLVAITESDTAVLLRWSDTSTIETSFEVERTPTGGAPETVAVVPANTAEFHDETAAAETEYRYRVRTVADAGTSPWSPSATTRTAPAAPSEPFGAAISSSRLRLSWTDNSHVEKGFEVRRRIHGSELPLALVARLGPDVTEYVDEGLLQETSYDYAVNAYDSSGDSNPIEVTELETTAVLVIRSVKLKAAKAKKKGEKPASMTVKAHIDFGGYEPDAADGVTIGVNGTVLVIHEVKANKGKLSAKNVDGVSFALDRKSETASRGSLTIKVVGDAAAVELDSELTIAFTTGSFIAAGSVVPANGRFDLVKRTGERVDPDFVPTKLKLKLRGLENDTLLLGATFEPRPELPMEVPNALVTVGEGRVAFSGETAEVDAGKLRVTYELEGLPTAKLTVDYGKGTIQLKAKKHELGDYDKGDVPTLLDVTIGDLRWRDMPVLRVKGKNASY